MLGYLSVLHPIGKDGKFVYDSREIFSELIASLNSGETTGHYGLLSSYATARARNAQGYEGKETLPFYSSSVTDTVDFHSIWAKDDLGVLPGAFAFGSIKSGEEAAATLTEFQNLAPRVSLISETLARIPHSQSTLAALLDQYTFDPVGGSSIQYRIAKAVKDHQAHSRPFDMCAVLAPSTLIVHSPVGFNNASVGLFVVWISGSVYLIWHSNSDLVMESILSLNQNRDIVKLIGSTIGFSYIPLRGTFCLTFNVLLKHITRDLTRAGHNSMRLSATISRTIYRLQKSIIQ